MTKTRIITPGELLEEEFLKPAGITRYALSHATGIPESRLSKLVARPPATSITADVASRLAAFFGNSAEFWMNAQAHYDLLLAQREHGQEYRKIRQLPIAAG